MAWPRGLPKVIPPARDFTHTSRPAPSLPPAARGPSRTWRSVIQKRTLGSMRAVAPPQPETRGSRVSSFPCSSSWDLGDGCRGRRRQATGGGGAGRRARPGARAPVSQYPGLRTRRPVTTRQRLGRLVSAVFAPGFLRVRCSVSPCANARGPPHPVFPRLGPGAPASRCHHLPAPPGPTPLPPETPRTQCSCDSNSPIAQVISILLHPSE